MDTATVELQVNARRKRKYRSPPEGRSSSNRWPKAVDRAAKAAGRLTEAGLAMGGCYNVRWRNRAVYRRQINNVVQGKKQADAREACGNIREGGSMAKRLERGTMTSTESRLSA